ncbi:cleavage stimulation factor subunit 2 tau variant isoform X1 [Plutella xylostella]|uniref:cleavage stimulation factor subunit 2 tau variant isoform X1 n=1 Tax=Plutella xylostella TaxID=51655 RepID=UPI002032F2B0|nr:cleavage stimulation factor subunit 2 tau variant isoform X1 [Plutella xylostella]
MDKSKEKEEQSIMDKSMRSVFVGNIPYEATEEKLKDIFSEVGPVLSFKLVFDRETGKPKGYGFCEYKDQETALSAMRNLNGYEIGGRSLRVDNACTEKSRMEMQALMQGPQIENPYGEPVDPEKAPEAISKAVATLPPEQMFELMKQMKLCIQNNPTEARNMLLQNPQLAYALLQAQVVMRIVDPVTAVSMLHPSNPVPPVLHPGDKPPPQVNPYIPSNSQGQPPLLSNPVPPQNQFGRPMGDVDLRGARAAMLDQDMRSLPPVPMPVPPVMQNDNPAITTDVVIPESYPRDPRLAGQFNSDPRVRPSDPRDPRSQNKQPQQQQMPPGMPSMAQARTIQGIPSGASDQEKAALIMQVLQLSDEQIALLPPEQRASILMLKEQIAKSTQQR